ncbi:WbqC family protein [candidate division KSB1 bacterium]|nr:WbqC family protein [candidate division KSB1 bacterium]
MTLQRAEHHQPGRPRKLAAFLPGYLPQLSVFQKLKCADVCLAADDLKYTRTANLNRTGIKNINGKLWLTVPVLSAGNSIQKINTVRIDNHENWRQKHYRSLVTNYRNSPYFYRFIDVLETIYTREWHFLADLNAALLEVARKELRLNAEFIRGSDFSENDNMNLRLVEIMQATGCAVYVAEEFYKPYIDVALLREHQLTVEFIAPKPPFYYQQFERFIPDLSCIDLLFNEGEMSMEKL